MKNPVDPQIWSKFKGLLANLAFTCSSRIPVVFDATPAVIVAAWDGDRVVENILTDAAPKLLLGDCRGHAPAKRHDHGMTVMAMHVQQHCNVLKKNNLKSESFNISTFRFEDQLVKYPRYTAH